MAPRHVRSAAIAVRSHSSACFPNKRPQGTSGRDTIDRVARGRGRAYEVLALDARQENYIQASRGCCQNALAHRTRLPGAEAGNRARPLRRTWMARLPSPRFALHRSLRISDLRAGDDSPLRTWFVQAIQKTCNSQSLSTPRRPRCGPNVTSPIQSRPYTGGWSSLLLECCLAVPAGPQLHTEMAP